MDTVLELYFPHFLTSLRKANPELVSTDKNCCLKSFIHEFEMPVGRECYSVDVTEDMPFIF